MRRIRCSVALIRDYMPVFCKREEIWEPKTVCLHKLTSARLSVFFYMHSSIRLFYMHARMTDSDWTLQEQCATLCAATRRCSIFYFQSD